jgi:cobyrinic acid a,c-diamide synthase
MSQATIPGLIISAPRSGAGKTTVMLGLLRCLAEDGVKVRPYKCGPDYIDPAFHRAACGKDSRNLDSWAMDPGLLADQLGLPGEMAVAEGSMGLFDGVAKAGASGNGATADIAAATGWPVVVVMDVSGHAQTVAALAVGLRHFRRDVQVAGVILNRVASPRHERLCRLALDEAEIPVFGALPRRGDLTLPERHLGLVQAAEHPNLDAAIVGYAGFLRAHVDLVALRALAAGGRPLQPPRRIRSPAQRIALARDEAFSFAYPHLLAGWRKAGAEILAFSPLANEPPPDADCCWLPGGYPELHAGRLAGAQDFLAGLRHFARDRPVHGECGGYMVLGETLTDAGGQVHRMAGLLGLETTYASRRMHLGYRQARLLSPLPGQDAGQRLLGHEFHYSTILAQPDAPLAEVFDADNNAVPETGSRRGNVTGTFFHLIAEAS